MKIGGEIRYKGYSITHPIKDDYITEIAHDTLKDAKAFIDRLIEKDEIEEGDDDNRK